MTEQTPTPDNTILVGQIVAAFGVRGQVKMKAITDQVDHLRRRIGTLYLGPKLQAYQLKRLLEHKPGLLVLTLGGVTTREQAEDLRGQEVAILESQAAPLAEGEYFIHQLYGLKVLTEAGDEIGTVGEVLETGANDVLVVKRPGQSDGLIPMIHDVVRELDTAGGRVVIHLLPGLLD
ncbi:MAG TPA: ribosome maturation factor RimM [Kouleothrix sp.]|uniref:ribosome maturation factor RimM n=1 Tax=Kouleothrix sp. TaxID=2779161 RepID=UPI002BF36872|nr:ribosome maturation factor RimM [Kouleothrix sp.]HRC74067.1 ribosome maturation factor RimM [Kouleothrix sp.]